MVRIKILIQQKIVLRIIRGLSSGLSKKRDLQQIRRTLPEFDHDTTQLEYRYLQNRGLSGSVRELQTTTRMIKILASFFLCRICFSREKLKRFLMRIPEVLVVGSVQAIHD